MNSKPKKATTDTERVTTVINLLCMGLTRAEINRYVAKKTDWKAAPATIKNYIDEAAKTLRSKADYDRDYHLGQAIDRLTELYKRAVSIQDIKAALAVQKELNQLLGLEQAKVKEEQAERQEKTRKKTDVDKLYDAIDDNLGDLADGVNSTYIEMIVAAAEKIKSQGKQIEFLIKPTAGKIKSNRKNA